MVLASSAPADELVHAVEQDLMAALAGLLRRVDRHRLRSKSRSALAEACPLARS
jgi:hypothetical protein